MGVILSKAALLLDLINLQVSYSVRAMSRVSVCGLFVHLKISQSATKSPPPTGARTSPFVYEMIGGTISVSGWFFFFFSRKAGAMGQMANVVEAALQNPDPEETNEKFMRMKVFSREYR